MSSEPEYGFGASTPDPTPVPPVPMVVPAETSPTIERANRLMNLKAHPGFPDLVRLSQDLCEKAAKDCAEFPGWDPLQITMLKVRMQVALEYHQIFFARIKEAIEDGIAEARVRDQALLEHATSESDRIAIAADALNRSDQVRMKVLEQFSHQDEMRVAGSY